MKTSDCPLVSPATKFEALESNATNLPSALIEGFRLFPFARLPSGANDTRLVLGTHPVGTPMHVSRRKMSA
jgi:hypothetical protein